LADDVVRRKPSPSSARLPAPWVVAVTCGAWSASETVDVQRRFKDATGTTQGSLTTVRGTVGQVGLSVE
jgi:hypothetical protein